jgi:predicted TIM-barrel fold metal-dependent hydrolase
VSERLAPDRAVSAPRLTDSVLLRHLLWAGVARGLPIQLHTGFGDPDLDLGRSDPALLTAFLRAVQPRGVDVILLHCYPFHRHAGYLAQVFPHVYADLGLTLGHVGARAAAVIAESLELTPFHKLLFSTDAFGLPELYCAGAALFRDGITSALRAWVMEGSWARSDARRAARLVGAGNAARVYRLGQAVPG